jgi:hypothetical protein
MASRKPPASHDVHGEAAEWLSHAPGRVRQRLVGTTPSIPLHTEFGRDRPTDRRVPRIRRQLYGLVESRT